MCVVCLLFVCLFVCYCYCCSSGLVGCWFLVLFCFSFGRNSFWFTYNMEHVFPSTFWLHISSHLLSISVSCKIWIVKCWNSPLFLSPSTRFWSFYKDSGLSLIKVVLSYLTLSVTSCHSIFTQIGFSLKDLNRSKFTSIHIILVKLYEVVSLRATNFP